NRDLEHAVVVGGRDLALADALREADGAGERAEAALEAVVALPRDLLAALALGADGERAVLDLDRDLVPRHAGQVERVDDRVVRLPCVERRHPGLRRAAVALEEPVHQAREFVVNRSGLAKRVPANQSGHLEVLPPCLMATKE